MPTRLHDAIRNIWVIQLDGVAPFENLWSATGTRLQRAWSGFPHPLRIFRNYVVSNNYLRRTVTNPIRIAHAISCSEFIHGLRVLHNDIADTSGQAVRNSWRCGGSKGGHAGGIEYAWNRTSQVGRAGFSDYGALYIACANNGEPNVIPHNFVDGIGDPDQDNIGIYLDAHVTDGEIRDNVLLNVGKKRSQFGNYWAGFVASRGNSAHHNWVHGNRSVQDLYLPWFFGVFEYLGLKTRTGIIGCPSAGSAPGGVAQRLACLPQPWWLELGDLSSEGGPWNGVDAVEVDDALGWDTVVGVQVEL